LAQVVAEWAQTAGGEAVVKAIALISRKSGISREEFAKHYEEVHAPLALKHLPMIKRYLRNHVVDMPGEEGPDFDCVTEFWFDSMEDAVKVTEFLQSDAGQVIRDDEDKFLDRDKGVAFLVDERVSDI
jgi:uncharacterized protein (TIGR02118 family)